MFFRTKDERLFFITKETEERNEQYIDVLIARDIDFNEIGFLKYKVGKDKAYLYNIQVTEENYLNKGVGHHLISEFEKDLIDRKVDFINGKYYPEGIGGSFAKSFYERHGYKIECYGQGDWEVVKYLDLSLDIKSNVKEEKAPTFNEN